MLCSLVSVTFLDFWSVMTMCWMISRHVQLVCSQGIPTSLRGYDMGMRWWEKENWRRRSLGDLREERESTAGFLLLSWECGVRVSGSDLRSSRRDVCVSLQPTCCHNRSRACVSRQYVMNMGPETMWHTFWGRLGGDGLWDSRETRARCKEGCS